MSCPGRYEIRSLVQQHPPVGVAPLLPPREGTGPVIISQPIHIDGTGIWELTQPSGKGDNIYQFSIVDQYPYTGVSGKQPLEKSTVIATEVADENRLWYVKKVEGAPFDTYIVALADDTSLGWTVFGVGGPGANIALGILPPPNVDNETLPNPFYHLFTFTPVLEK